MMQAQHYCEAPFGTPELMPKLKILFADDDPEIRTIMTMFLQEHYELLIARDGLEAWRLFEEGKPRLVVTDLNMPGINGLELTEKIRRHEQRGNTPVIILTGTTKDDDLPGGFWKIGTKADKYLDKPFDPDRLIDEIRRLILEHAKIQPLPPGKGFYEVH